MALAIQKEVSHISELGKHALIVDIFYLQVLWGLYRISLKRKKELPLVVSPCSEVKVKSLSVSSPSMVTYTVSPRGMLTSSGSRNMSEYPSVSIIQS